MLEGAKIEIGAELAVDARQQIEIEFRRDALGVVIGVIENFRILHQIDADHEQRARAQHAAGVAQEFAGFVRLEIADGGAGKKTDPRQRGDRRRQRERLGEILDQRIDAEMRKIPAQLGGVLLQEIAGNIDRHIGLHRRRGAEQDARLAARAAAEFDQGAVLRKQRGDRRRIVLQNADLAAGRIIFRQPGDAVEQRRAGEVVEIFRRQAFRLRRKTGDNVGRERFVRCGRCRAPRGLDSSSHGFAQCSYSARRKPVNCQRADG